MDNNVLLIDAGNSSMKWALSNFDGLSEMVSIPYSEKVTAVLFIDCWKEIKRPIKIIASCVASEAVWQALVKACDELWGLKVQRVISPKEGYGLTNAYNNPSDLGSDRWCAMLGVSHIEKSAFIVVDLGSAVTIDMVDQSGKHLGGYIIPGINMMKQTLGLQTAQVSVTHEQDLIPSLSLANTTAECVESGIYLSVIKLIEAVFENESKQAKKLECYLTGGDAKLIANLLSFKCVIMPDVVLRGLAEIVDR